MELTEEELKMLEGTARYNRTNTPSLLWEISLENQRRYEELLSLAERLHEENEEHQCEEFYKAQDQAFKVGYIAIVFSVMYIEGSVYNFGCIYLGDEYIQSNLDRLSTLSKINVILRLVTGSELDKQGQAYEHLKRLIKYRNSIIHPKSEALDMDRLIAQYEKRNNEYRLAIESAKQAIKYLDNETKLIHKDEFHPGLFGLF